MATQVSGEGALIEPKDGLSYVRGSTEIPLSEATVAQFLRDTAGRFPDRPAVVFREQRIRWTWKEFADEVDVLASGLLALGIVKGDRVGIWSPNRVEWLLTQFATARIGAVLVNINPAYRLAELEYALNKVGCKAIIAAERFKTSMYLEMLQELAPELAAQRPGELRAAKLPELRYVIRMCDTETPGMLSFSDLIERGRATLDVPKLDAIGATLSCHEPINIQFTSGTTGNPKGATLTHSNVVNNARYIAMAMRLTEQDGLCIPVPLYHCFGMVLAVLASVSVGANMVFPGEGFDPAATLVAVAEEKCTALHGVPTMFIAELDHPRFAEFDLSALRTGIMAGSPCPIAVMRRVVAEMHMPEVTICYGMTETSPVSFQSRHDDPLERRVATVGRVHPHVQVKIIDSGGRVTPRGTPGEILTRGYSVMRGYWDDEERTRDAIDAGGWMHTGDLGIIDELGYCNIVGRVKDMIIRGGENVSPREIEEFLYRHPAVLDVAVVGVPDAKYGEAVCACIRLRDGMAATEEEIQEFCRGQIAHYKVPRYVRFVDNFPLTISGKVQKYLIREHLRSELNLAEDEHA